MIKSFIYFSALCFASFSCGKHSDLNPVPRKFQDELTLYPADTLKIPIGYRSNVYSKYIKVVTINDISYLGIVNENTNQVEFISLNEYGDDFQISFQEEGPNGVGKVKAFEVISDSTLLIASTYRIRLYNTDFNGNILDVIKTDDSERIGHSYVQIYYTNQPLLFSKVNQSSYVFTRVDTDYLKPGIWSGTMFLESSIKDRIKNDHIFKLPSHFEEYVHGAYFCHSSHQLVHDRYLILGIPFYSRILIYDLQNERLFEKEAGSKHFGDALPWENPEAGMDESFYVPSNSYRELSYDSQNNILYRIAYRGVDYIGSDGNRRNWDNKIPSVIIINNDFEKVGEVDLPANTFYTRMYFTHEGKLYLSLNHPDNNPSEDQMVFVGFRPEKL